MHAFRPQERVAVRAGGFGHEHRALCRIDLVVLVGACSHSAGRICSRQLHCGTSGSRAHFRRAIAWVHIGQRSGVSASVAPEHCRLSAVLSVTRPLRWAGLGLLLGPPLGGFLYVASASALCSIFPYPQPRPFPHNLSSSRYDIGGYQLPFLLGAGLAFIDVLVVALLMDDSAAAAAPVPVPLDDDNDFSWRDMLKHRCVFHCRP